MSVICGAVKLEVGRPDTAINPCALIEVLSDATRDYDRGEKFTLYKSITTLRDYVLIDDRAIAIDHFTKSAAGAWRQRSLRSLDDRMSLASIQVSVRLDEVYRGVGVTTPPPVRTQNRSRRS